MKFVEFAMSHARIWTLMIVVGFVLALGSVVLFETSGISTALAIGGGLVLVGGMMTSIVVIVTIGIFTKKYDNRN